MRLSSMFDGVVGNGKIRASGGLPARPVCVRFRA